MDKTTNGPGKGTRTSSASKSDTTRQRESSTPPTNPIPPEARPRRATSAEMQTRVAYCIHMLIDGRRDHEVKQFFRTQYGVGSRQTQTYLLLARKRLAETNNLDIDQMRAEFYGRYMDIYRKTENDATKIAALKAAGSLYGLDAPRKVAETTADGKDVDIIRQTVRGLNVDELRALSRARDRLRRLTPCALILAPVGMCAE